MIDATHLKAHRTAASLLKKGLFPAVIGRTKGGLNSKLHAVCDGEGRPLVMLLSRRPDERPQGRRLVAATPCRRAKTLSPTAATTATPSAQRLVETGIEPCIPSSQKPKGPYPYDKALYRQRHKVENMFGRIKDWRRIATRYDRCAHTFISAICIAATVIFWLYQ